MGYGWETEPGVFLLNIGTDESPNWVMLGASK